MSEYVPMSEKCPISFFEFVPYLSDFSSQKVGWYMFRVALIKTGLKRGSKQKHEEEKPQSVKIEYFFRESTNSSTTKSLILTEIKKKSTLELLWIDFFRENAAYIKDRNCILQEDENKENSWNCHDFNSEKAETCPNCSFSVKRKKNAENLPIKVLELLWLEQDHKKSVELWRKVRQTAKKFVEINKIS